MSATRFMLRSLGDEWAEKWPVALVAYLMMLFAFGVPTFALAFIYDGAMQEFDWTRQEAVRLASFKFYTAAIASLIIGRLLDIFDPKYLISICAILGGIGMMAFGMVDSLPTYYFIGFVLGFNSAGMSVSTHVIVCRTFERSAGTALGIVLAGTSTAGIIVPLTMAPLIENVGWKTTMMIMSAGIWIVALPAWLFLLRDGSELAAKLRSVHFSAARTGMLQHLRKLARTKHFWYIVVGIFLVSAVDQGFLQNQVLFLKNEKNLELNVVAWGASLLAAIGIVSKIAFGWVYDRLSITGIVLCYLLLAISTGLAFTVAGVVTMLIFMSIRGLAHGGLIVDVPVLAKHYYGPENFGLNIGLFTLCMSLGFGFGPDLMARMADDSGTYTGAFAVALVASIVATMLLLPIKPRFWTRP